MEDEVTKEFAQTLRQKFKKKLKRIILFGSRARGDYSRESDYDFIVIFDKVTKQIKEFVDNLAVDLLLKRNAVISEFIMEKKSFKQMRFEPFIMNARREGRVL